MAPLLAILQKKGFRPSLLLLEYTANGETWIRVTSFQAGVEVIREITLQPGESVVGRISLELRKSNVTVSPGLGFEAPAFFTVPSPNKAKLRDITGLKPSDGLIVGIRDVTSSGWSIAERLWMARWWIHWLLQLFYGLIVLMCLSWEQDWIGWARFLVVVVLAWPVAGIWKVFADFRPKLRVGRGRRRGVRHRLAPLHGLFWRVFLPLHRLVCVV
ncbi:hypothetical protein FT663_05080 [Candidozyma haemuli var. vulneris]|nr:hypothetical protein FT663_05080 [[Candida] haemuloni var. vulneris]KAF3991775.1 hypothetical protein FT662_01529 [[Candida] haemuloni var. vulneris]